MLGGQEGIGFLVFLVGVAQFGSVMPFMLVIAIILATGGTLVAWYGWRQLLKCRFPNERRWDCSAIDVAPIAERLERVRLDYVGAFHSSHASRFFSEQLLSIARRAVLHLSFFCRRNDAGDEKDDH